MYALGLSQRGFDVEIHPTGPDFLARTTGKRPDVIVLEWEFGRSTAGGTLEALRQDDQTRSIPVVVLTGYVASNGDSHPAQDLGIAAWLEKIHTPPQELAEVVERFAREAGR